MRSVGRHGGTSRAVTAAGTAPDSTMTARPSDDVAAMAAHISRALCTAAASAAIAAACEAAVSVPAAGGGLRMNWLMPPLRNT